MDPVVEVVHGDLLVELPLGIGSMREDAEDHDVAVSRQVPAYYGSRAVRRREPGRQQQMRRRERAAREHDLLRGDARSCACDAVDTLDRGNAGTFANEPYTHGVGAEHHAPTQEAGDDGCGDVILGLGRARISVACAAPDAGVPAFGSLERDGQWDSKWAETEPTSGRRNDRCRAGKRGRGARVRRAAWWLRGICTCVAANT